MKSLFVKVPFVFSKILDHRHVFTVGDQMIAEHVFAYHQNFSWKQGNQKLFSAIKPDYVHNTLTIIPERVIKDHKGNEFHIQNICDSLKKSFKGTIHSQYKDIVKEISCQKDKVVVTFKMIPNNWVSLFSTPDFALTDGGMFTGPYFIESSDSNKVHLKRNSFYPAEMRANNIDNIFIDSYSASETDKIIKMLDPKNDHATFFYGHVLNKAHIDSLREKKFNLQIFQSEWLVYLGFTKKISLADRKIVTSFINSKRLELKQFAQLGVDAYSMAPMERQWSIDKKTYESLHEKIKDVKLKKQYTLATLDEWANLPLFEHIIKILKNKFNIQVKTFCRNEMNKIYEDGGDFFLSPIGVSPDDPIGHFYFFTSLSDEYEKILNQHRKLEETAFIRDSIEFNHAVKDLEMQIIRNYLIVPLFHYPSVVAEGPQLQKDSKLSWDWGIQAWTYQIR